MRGPISHLHKKPMKMPKQSERCLGSEGKKRRKGGGSRQDRRGAPINLSQCPALYHSGEYFSSTSSHSLAPHLSLTLSIPITQKGCCHLLSAPSLTRREHIKVGLKPREARDQSQALISLGRRLIDGYARSGGGGGGGGHTLDRVPMQSSKT